MDQQPQSPPIFGPTGQVISKATSEANSYHQLAKAQEDVEKTIIRYIGTMRRMGTGFEDISKIGETLFQTEMKVLQMRKGEVDAWKNLAPEMNLTIEQMKKMPLRDVGKNIGNLGNSMLNLVKSGLTLGNTLAIMGTTFKTVYDSLSSMNSAASNFALARGDIKGANSIGYEDRNAMITAKASGAMMGYSSDDMASIQRTLSSQLRMTSGQGAKASLEVGALAKLGQEDPAATGKRIAEALKSGIKLSDVDAAFDYIQKNAKDFGTSMSQASIESHDFFMANRALGMSELEATKAMDKFSGSVHKGVETMSGLLNLDPARRQFSQNMQSIALAKMTGVNIPGVTDQPNMLKALGNLLKMPADQRIEKMGKIYDQGIPGLAGKMSGDSAVQQAFRQMLLGAFGGGLSPERSLAIQQGTSRAAPEMNTEGVKHLGKRLQEAAQNEGETASTFKTMKDAATLFSSGVDKFVNGFSEKPANRPVSSEALRRSAWEGEGFGPPD